MYKDEIELTENFEEKEEEICSKKDETQLLISEILTDMAPHLSAEQLSIMQEVIINKMRRYSVFHMTTELSCSVDDNYKFISMFVASRRLEGMSERTLRSYIFYTKAMLSMVGKNFREITTMDIQFYLFEYERIHHVQKRSLDNIRKGINGWFLWLEEIDAISVNPLRKIRPIAYEEKAIIVLNDDDIVNIRNVLYGDTKEKIRNRAMVEFLLSTGVRVSELCNINTTDVNFETNTVIIHCAKKRRKEDRYVFLSAEARKYLKDYLDYRNAKEWNNSPALFQSNRKGGKRITERVVNTELRKIEIESGIKKDLTCHTFRKTVASRLHKRGMSNTDVAKYLGHEDSSTSEKYYINVDIDNLRCEFNKYI